MILEMAPIAFQAVLEAFKSVRGIEYKGALNRAQPRPSSSRLMPGTPLADPASYDQVAVQRRVPRSLPELLVLAYGLTAVEEGEPLLSVPSAGASYPVDLFIVNRDPEIYPTGLFYYSPFQSSIHCIGDDPESIGILPGESSKMEAGLSCYIVIALAPIRSSWKYATRGYRFCTIDAGHVFGNFQILLETLGANYQIHALTPRLPQLSEKLQLADSEQILGIIQLDRLALRKVNAAVIHGDLCRSRQTSPAQAFDWTGIDAFNECVHRDFRPPHPGLQFTRLPAAVMDHTELCKVLGRRRSACGFADSSISSSDFEFLVNYLRSVLGQTRCFLAVRHADGTAPGIYSIAAQGLEPITMGCPAVDLTYACLSQKIVGDGALALVFVIPLDLQAEHAACDYQRWCVEIGMMAQGLFVHLALLGLAFSPVGGFYDDELGQILGLRGDEHPVYMGCVGNASEREAKADRSGRRSA